MDAGLRVTALAGTSAGSAMAASLLQGNHKDVVEYFRSVTLRNPANFHARKLLIGSRPFPHEKMFRRAIATYIDWKNFVQSKIKIVVNALQVPEEIYSSAWKRARLVMRIMSAYRREMKTVDTGRYRPYLIEESAASKLQEVTFRNADFSSVGRVEDIILASSSVPPMVRFQKFDGRYFLDGGIFRNLAIDLLEDVDVAVGIHYDIWSRLQYERGHGFKRSEIDVTAKEGKRPRRVFLCPDKRLPIQTWDYANPRGVTLAYEEGLRAGERLLPILKRMS